MTRTDHALDARRERRHNAGPSSGFTELGPAQSFDGFAEAAAFAVESLDRQFPGSCPFITRLRGTGEVQLFDTDREPGDPVPTGRANLGYVAVPLELGDGSHVGSLCVIDRGHDPARVRGLLEVMARLLVTAIEREDREQTLRASNDRLRTLAKTDPLTGLPNRGAFEQGLRREWRLARRHREDEDAYLVIADVDDLKPVNDRHGHMRGDDLLRDVADALREATRETDIVARVGGDEFAVLLVRSGEAGYIRFRDRIEEALAERSSGIDGAPRLSVGGVPLGSSETWGDALDAADRAMYYEKLRRREARAAA